MPKIADDFDLNDGYQNIYRDMYGNRYDVTLEERRKSLAESKTIQLWQSSVWYAPSPPVHSRGSHA